LKQELSVLWTVGCHEEAAIETLRAVVVEDDYDMRRLERTVLEKGGYEVDDVADPDALFATLANGPAPDVILLDLTLSGPVSGWHILRQLHADAGLSQIPVVIVSGRDDDQFREAANALGVCDYVTKPYRPTDLLRAVGTNVRGGRSVDRRVV
jgi:DNA-binding response OmpR family regulator